jgi:adenylate kinase
VPGKDGGKPGTRIMMNRRLTIALMGPPGCGKGTQARVLAERLNLVHLSSGDIVRENIRGQTEIGRAFQEATARGELGPTHLVTDMVRERLAALSAYSKHCVLDGFPRTLAQAEMLAGMGLPDAVVSITVGTDEVIRRISGRLSCSCGAVYHATDAPPQIPGTCDRCGGRLFTRPDDRQAAVRVRMDEYTRETLPLLDYYRKAGKLCEIDGAGRPDQVTARITAALSHLTPPSAGHLSPIDPVGRTGE